MRSHAAITSSFFLKFQCKGTAFFGYMQEFAHFGTKKECRSRVLSMRMIVSTQDRENIK